MDEIMVSVYVLAYNHENYIEDALKSIVNQKTNFKYEIIVHEDASPDGTALIIKEYETKYPDKMRVIYQTDNQWSKGTDIVAEFIRPLVRGKYIAICEGDDYWTDDFKLQKQVDYMENNNECNMCIHAANVVNASDKKIIKRYASLNTSRIVKPEELILGGGGFCATNSIMYRTSADKNQAEFDSLFSKKTPGDLKIQLYFALNGQVYYMNENMAAYRAFVKGSWSHRQKSNSRVLEINKNEIIVNQKANEYTNYKYNDAFCERVHKLNFEILIIKNDFKTLKSPEYIDEYKELGNKNKLKMHIKKWVPHLVKCYNKIRNKKRYK